MVYAENEEPVVVSTVSVEGKNPQQIHSLFMEWFEKQTIQHYPCEVIESSHQYIKAYHREIRKGGRFGRPSWDRPQVQEKYIELWLIETSSGTKIQVDITPRKTNLIVTDLAGRRIKWTNLLCNMYNNIGVDVSSVNLKELYPESLFNEHLKGRKNAIRDSLILYFIPSFLLFLWTFIYRFNNELVETFWFLSSMVVVLVSLGIVFDIFDYFNIKSRSTRIHHNGTD